MKSVEGIILKKTPRREADAVFTLYTKEHGLMELQAKSVRKAGGKLKAGLDLFNHSQIFFVPAKYLPIITDFKIKDSHQVLKSDLYRIKLATTAATLVNKIFEPSLADEKMWSKLKNYFGELNRGFLDREQLSGRSYSFYYQILVLNGLKPELAQCTACAKAIWSDKLTISLINGGLVHYDCLNKSVLPYEIANNTVVLAPAVVNLAQRLGEFQEPDYKVDENTQNGFKKLTQILFEYHFGLSLGKLI